MMDTLSRSGILLLLVAIWSSLFSFGVRAEAEAEPTFAAVKMARGDELDSSNGFIQAVDPDQINLTSGDSAFTNVSFPDTPRHVAEKKKLLDRLQRKDNDKWTSSHVRYRLLDALYAYAKYYPRQIEELDRLKGLYDKVSGPQRALLEKQINYSDKFTKADELLQLNQQLCDRIVDNALAFYQVDRAELDKHIKHLEQDGKKADKIAVSQALKHVVRDWTVPGGAYERDHCFECLTKTLEKLFPEREKKDVKILLPGAGLGRLGMDIAEQGGYEVTINEWSMFMNVAYRFLETHAHTTNNAFVHPFIDGWSHHASTADQQRKLFFPDAPLDASQVLLVEGDFTTVFNGMKPDDRFDVIVTYFFIDTARNLASYFDTIQTLLKPGGYWVNLGPLLYGSAPFMMLSLEEIVKVVEDGLGFEFLDVGGDECGEITLEGKLVRGMEAAYGFNDRALTKNAYQAQFWVAQKKK